MRYERHSSLKNIANGMLALLCIFMFLSTQFVLGSPAFVEALWIFFVWPLWSRKKAFENTVFFPMLLALALLFWAGTASRGLTPLVMQDKPFGHLLMWLNISVCFYIAAISLPTTLLPLQAIEKVKRWWPFLKSTFIAAFIITGAFICFSPDFIEQFFALFLTWALFSCFAMKEDNEKLFFELNAVPIAVFFAVAFSIILRQYGPLVGWTVDTMALIGVLYKITVGAMVVRLGSHLVQSTRESILCIQNRAPQPVLQTIKTNTAEKEAANFLSEENYNA